MNHKSINCQVKGCKNEATRWIDTAELSGDFDVKSDTFYFCGEHNLEDDNGYYTYLNPETGKVRSIEVAVYSCNLDCVYCNN